MSLSQQTGQDDLTFTKAVKLAANESDLAVTTLQDTMCLVILIGCKDTSLREKMSELEESTKAAFNILIDAHMHRKAMLVHAILARTNTQPGIGRAGMAEMAVQLVNRDSSSQSLGWRKRGGRS